MAKEILTRIGLKVDTLTAWEASTITLLKGELAIATVAAGAGSGLSEPVIMIKVGDGEHTFKNLDWAVHAKASDVYSWAKKSEKDFVDGFLALTNGTQTLGQLLDAIYITHDEQTNALTQLKTELTGIYYNKTELDAIIGNLTNLNTTYKDDLVGAINEALQAVEVGGTGSVVTVTKEETPTEGSQATYVVKQGGNAVGAKIEIPVGYDETTLKGRVDAIEADYVKAADIANFETKDNVKKVADDLAAYEEANDAAVAAVKATADAAAVKTEVEAALNERYTKTEADTKFEVAGAAAQALTDAKDYTDTQIQAIMGGEVDEAYNSFLEIQNFLKADETATAQLVEKVNANEAAAAAAQETADAALPTATAEADYLKKADAATTYEPIGAQAAAEATAKGYTDAEIAKLGNIYDAKGAAADAQAAAIADAAEKYETKGTAQGIVDGLNLAETYEPIGAETRAVAAAKTETENQIAALNIGDYAKSADVATTYRAKADKITSDDLSDEVFVFNCGTATLVV